MIGGWLPGNGRRSDTVGSLLLGYHDEEGVLRFAGAAGSGLRDADLAAFSSALARIATDECPFGSENRSLIPRQARWVVPCVVVEVRFTEWTSAGIIRNPVYLGVRDDKDPATITRESPSPRRPLPGT